MWLKSSCETFDTRERSSSLYNSLSVDMIKSFQSRERTTGIGNFRWMDSAMSEKSRCRRLTDELKCNQLRISRNIINVVTVFYYRDCCRCWRVAASWGNKQQSGGRRWQEGNDDDEESTTITRHSEHHCYVST